jgi:hypothetical protein
MSQASNHTDAYIPTEADWELQRELGDCYANPLPTPEEEAEMREGTQQPRDDSDFPY